MAESTLTVTDLGWSDREALQLRFCLNCEGGGVPVCALRQLTRIDCEYLPSPEGFSATSVGSNYAELHWSAPEGMTVDSFLIRYVTTEIDGYVEQPLTTETHYRLPNLRPSTNYNVEVCYGCADVRERCSSISITTSGINCSEAGNLPLEFICGADGQIDFTEGQQLIAELYPGDSVWAGDFLVEIEEITSGPPWKGKGRMVVPYLNEAIVGVTFDTIQIDENCRMVSGSMEVISPFRELLESVSELVGDFNVAMSQVEAVVDHLRQLINQINDLTSAGQELTEVLEGLTEVAESYPYLPPEVAQELAAARDCLEQTPPAQRDSLCRARIEAALNTLDTAW